jgi:hypothetical protein
MWLFREFMVKERDKMLAEARELLAQARQSAKREYLAYDRVDPASQAFIYGIQPIFGNRYLISWLMEHKSNCNGLMKGAMASGDQQKVMFGLAQITMIDSLFMDLEMFEEKYKAILEEKKDERKSN